MRILIVDDNPTNVTLLKHLSLKQKDAEPETFLDPLEAYEWAKENQADLLLVDYMMPGMNGLEFITAFRALPNNADVPIVMVTTADERDVRYEALENGANDFLNKPVDATEFNARIKNLLSLRRSRNLLNNRASWLAEEVRKATAKIIAQEKELIHRLSKAAEFRDPETGGHILRMAHYSELIAKQMDLSKKNQETILRAAPMHDVGKVGIPDDILLKPGKLNDAEFSIMKEHATMGHLILDESQSPLIKIAAMIALTHHEKYDGTGYPHGLKGDEIPLMGRIVAVADVFDALTSERPYKKAWPLEDAKTFLQEQSGKHFCPDCVAAFMESWDAALEIRDSFVD